MTTHDHDELVPSFDELARVLLADPEHTPETITTWCVRLVPGCDHASIMVPQGRGFLTLAASDEIAATADRMERELKDGPCVDAITDEARQLDNDLTIDPTWPTLAQRLLRETPVRAAMAFRIVEGGRKRGALNLFSQRTGAFDATSGDIAAVLTAFASVALAAADESERAENLAGALDSNRQIGKAIGILMATHHLSDEAAFDVLRQTSQNMNRKLRDVAAELVLRSGPDASGSVGTGPSGG